MARTSLAGLVQRLFCDARGIDRSGVPASEFVERRTAQQQTRREFLGHSGKAILAATGAAAMGFDALAAGGRSGKVAIIGAGLAGLTCALRLRQAGIDSTVYEANDRLGGRCYTRRGFFADQQLVERGGELIDTDHTAVQELAVELGLKLDDLLLAEPSGTLPFYRFNGRAYTYSQILRRFRTIYPKLQSDLNAVGDIDYTGSTPRGYILDHTSVADYIEELTDDDVLSELLNVAYNIEYGAETGNQTALNLLFLLGYSARNSFDIFGESDERYHIRGGNDQLVSGMASLLSGSIQTGAPLASIRQKTDGRYRLDFAPGSGVKGVVADHVVLALPFSILRSAVDYAQAGFSPLKQTAIETLGMGASTKLHLQFRNRLWNTLGNNGDTFADTGYQNTWESSRAQAGKSGILINFTGGNTALRYGTGTLAQRTAEALQNLEPVLPGLSARFNGLSTLDYWPGNPWSRGSYSYWKVGQYSSIAGSVGLREGNVHFCGEHASFDYQGYLNGAVDTGNAAAAEVIADLA